jgi:hypothetical protein
VPLCGAHLLTYHRFSICKSGKGLLRSVGNRNPPEVAEESLALSEGVEEVVEVSSVVFHGTERGCRAIS